MMWKERMVHPVIALLLLAKSWHSGTASDSGTSNLFRSQRGVKSFKSHIPWPDISISYSRPPPPPVGNKFRSSHKSNNHYKFPNQQPTKSSLHTLSPDQINEVLKAATAASTTSQPLVSMMTPPTATYHHSQRNFKHHQTHSKRPKNFKTNYPQRDSYSSIPSLFEPNAYDIELIRSENVQNYRFPPSPQSSRNYGWDSKPFFSHHYSPPKSTPKGWGRKPSSNKYQNYAFSSSPPKSKQSKNKGGGSTWTKIRVLEFDGWGWGWGWGWKKECVNSSAPQDVVSRNDLPPGTTVYRPNMPNVRYQPEEVFPESFIPDPPPPLILLSSSSREVPTGYGIDSEEMFEIGANKSMRRMSSNESLQPKPNTMVLVSRTIRSPNISAPIGGYHAAANDTDRKFLTALDNVRMSRRESFPDPVETQVNLLGSLFSELRSMNQELKGRSAPQFRPLKLAAQMETFSIEEIDSGEGSILDAMYNFGPHASRIEFGEADNVLRLWEQLDTVGGQGSRSSTPNPVGDQVEELIARRLKGMREISSRSHSKVAAMAASGFRQNQFYWEPPAVSGECPAVVDPFNALNMLSLTSVTGTWNSTSIDDDFGFEGF